jgi:hypothetical protein
MYSSLCQARVDDPVVVQVNITEFPGQTCSTSLVSRALDKTVGTTVVKKCIYDNSIIFKILPLHLEKL